MKAYALVGRAKWKDYVDLYIETFENLPIVVTPAKAGIQKVLKRLDTGVRRYDDLPNIRSNSKLSYSVEGSLFSCSDFGKIKRPFQRLLQRETLPGTALLLS